MCTALSSSPPFDLEWLMESGSNNEFEEIRHALIFTLIQSIHNHVYPSAPTVVQYLREYVPEHPPRGNIFIETPMSSVPPALQTRCELLLLIYPLEDETLDDRLDRVQLITSVLAEEVGHYDNAILPTWDPLDQTEIVPILPLNVLKF